MEDHVIEVFLQKIDNQIAERIDKAVAEAKLANPRERGNPAAVVAPSLALSIPLLAIAGGIAGAFGIASVMLAVLGINLLYFIYELVA